MPRSASVFEALWEDKQLLTALASKCKLVSFKQGSVILRQKEKQTDPVMYIIQSGEVSARTRTHSIFVKAPKHSLSDALLQALAIRCSPS